MTRELITFAAGMATGAGLAVVAVAKWFSPLLDEIIELLEKQLAQSKERRS